MSALLPRVVLIGSMCFASAPAIGAPRRQVQLELVRLAGAERCPAREAIAADVAAYLGYDPFSEHAADRIRVTVSRTSGALDATVDLLGVDGSLEGTQTLTSEAPDCRQLAESLSLAISLAVDPLTAGSPLALPPVAPVAPPPEVVVVDAQPLPPAPRVPMLLSVGVGSLGSLGLAPGPALGVALDVEVRRGSYSLAIEGQGNLNTGLRVQAGSVEAQLLAASLVPCARLSAGIVGWGGCLLVTTGAELGAAQGFAGATHHTTPYLGVGARAFAELPLPDRFFLRPMLEVDVPIAVTTLQVQQLDVWTTSPVAGTLGLLAGVVLP